MRTIRNLFVEDLALKIWSLILAIIFWYAIQEEKEIDAHIQVDIQLKNRPSNLIITNTVSDKISLGLRGYRAKIRRLTDKSLPSYEIDLSNANPGSALFRVFPFDFTLPEGVQITHINPQLVTVELERQKTKKLPVQVRFSGELEKGFVLTDTLIEPSHVVVAGADSIVSTLSMIDTEALSLSGVREGFTTRLALNIPNNPNLWLNEASYVSVEVKVREEVISGIIEEIPINIVGPQASFRLKPAVASIVVKGKAGQVNDLLKTKPTVSVEVSASQLNQLKIKKLPKLALKPKYQIDDTVRVIKAMPERVQVTLNPVVN